MVMYRYIVIVDSPKDREQTRIGIERCLKKGSLNLRKVEVE